MDQSDLLLPSSDYYKLGFGHPIMQAYYDLLVSVATALGAPAARARAEMKRVVHFESRLASIMTPATVRRNYSEIYNKMSLERLQERVPGVNFSHYLEPLLPRRLDPAEEVVVYALPYFQKLTGLIEATDKRCGAI